VRNVRPTKKDNVTGKGKWEQKGKSRIELVGLGAAKIISGEVGKKEGDGVIASEKSYTIVHQKTLGEGKPIILQDLSRKKPTLK